MWCSQRATKLTDVQVKTTTETDLLLACDAKRQAMCEALQTQSERQLDAIKEYAASLRDAREIFKAGAQSASPLVWAWSGPFGHDYRNVLQTALPFEFAMVHVAQGLAQLRVGVSAMHSAAYVLANSLFEAAVCSLSEAKEEAKAWYDFKAVARAPPVLRRGAISSMQLHARAWQQLAWAAQSMSQAPDAAVPQHALHILAGAVKLARCAISFLKDVHAGVWRGACESFLRDVECIAVTVALQKRRSNVVHTGDSGALAGLTRAALKRLAPDSSASPCERALCQLSETIFQENTRLYYEKETQTHSDLHIEPEPTYVFDLAPELKVKLQ